MHNYSSAILELLALKWAVTKKFRDYLLGWKFTVYTDNIPLAYIQTSKLGASQIRWLSELALFDFNIIYRSGKSNQATDALTWCPEPNCKLESDNDSDNDSSDPVMLSYATICNIIKPVLGDTKIPLTIKKKAQAAGTETRSSHIRTVTVIQSVCPSTEIKSGKHLRCFEVGRVVFSGKCGAYGISLLLSCAKGPAWYHCLWFGGWALR